MHSTTAVPTGMPNLFTKLKYTISMSIEREILAFIGMQHVDNMTKWKWVCNAHTLLTF